MTLTITRSDSEVTLQLEPETEADRALIKELSPPSEAQVAGAIFSPNLIIRIKRP